MTKEVKAQLGQIILRIGRNVFGYTVKFEKTGLLEDGMNDLTKVIGKVAEDKAVEVCKKVQEATKSGFEQFAKDMEELKGRVAELETHTVKNYQDPE